MLGYTDLGYCNTGVNYEHARADGVLGAALRIAQGTPLSTTKSGIIEDKQYPTHKAGCDASGILWSSYFFSDYRFDATAQAKKYVELAAGDWGKTRYPAWMDLEYEDYPPLNWPRPSAYNMYLWGCEFIEAFEKAAPGVEIGPYMNLALLKAMRPYLRKGDPFLRHPLWIAAWVQAKDLDVSPWDRWTLWQYAGDVKADWTKTAVDWDWFNGGEADLRPKKKWYSFLPWIGNKTVSGVGGAVDFSHPLK